LYFVTRKLSVSLCVFVRRFILADGGLEGLGLLRRPFLGIAVDSPVAARFAAVATSPKSRIGPGEQEPRAIGPPAPSPYCPHKAAADQHIDLGHARGGHGAVTSFAP
jgi:hypothetical protein